MKRPTDEQLDTARTWLECNEGEGAEGEACRTVADWLAHLQNERALWLIARRAGVTKAKARAALASLEP